MTVQTYFTDIRKLYHNGNNFQRCFQDGGEIFEAYHNGEKVFNRALYTLSGDDVAIEATGTGAVPLWELAAIFSYKTDRDGTVTDVNFSGGEDVIPPNYTPYPTSGEFYITQDVCNQSIKLNWTQEPEQYEGTYVTNVQSNDVDSEIGLPEGGRIDIAITAQAMYTDHYTSGRTESYSDVVAATVTKIYGDPINSSGAVNKTTYIEALPLKTTTGERQAIFQIWRVDGTVNIGEDSYDITWTSPDSINYLIVYQDSSKITQDKPNEQ